MVRNVSPLILSTSGISLLVYEGNKFDAKALQGVEGYEKVKITFSFNNDNQASLVGLKIFKVKFERLYKWVKMFSKQCALS